MTKFDVFEELKLNQEVVEKPSISTKYDSCRFSQDTNVNVNVDKIVVNLGEQPKESFSSGGITSLALGGVGSYVLLNPTSIVGLSTTLPVVGMAILGVVALVCISDLFK